MEEFRGYFPSKKGITNMIKTEREFSQLCKHYGFARLAPRFYARCIGDGIYQTIYTGFREYIDIRSPYYSSENRKSYYISIGLRSIYSCHNEDTFIPGKNPGGYRPADLYTKSKFSGPFNGIEEEYAYMEEKGFDVLDEISSQEKLLEWWNSVQVIDTGYRMHSISLVEPFLLCGLLHEAECEISVSYIQTMSAYFSYKAHVESGRLEAYYPYEQRIWESAERDLTFWHWCMGRQYKEFDAYIHENYQRNMEWIQKYGIPTISLSSPRSVSCVFD